MPLNTDTLYSEACSALRHYSNCVMQVRTWTIVQGFTVLTAVYILINEGNYIYSLGLSIFGVSFTIILNILHGNYGKHHESFLRYVVNLEEQKGPWSAYEVHRDTRLQNRVYKLMIWSGPVLLLILSMFAAFLYSLIELVHGG